jgi:pyruvate,water dikinase
METMMGVAEALPEDTIRAMHRKSATRDIAAVAKMLIALTYRYTRLNRDIRAFHCRIAYALSTSPSLSDLDRDALLAEFSRLENALLANWQAPLVNDFFAMVFYGVLRVMTARWCGDTDGSLHNDLLCAGGGMVSTEPARRVRELAALVASDAELLEVLERGDAADAVRLISSRPRVFRQYAAYLDRFADRCPNELKLESRTLRDDPLPLLRAIASIAKYSRDDRAGAEDAVAVRNAAEQRVAGALRRYPLRRAAYAFVLKHARTRIRDRENLRLERTRVFARVREIMRALGQRLHDAGEIANPDDVFFAELAELRSGNLAKVAERRELYRYYTSLPAPPDRFSAIGATAPRAVPAVSSGDDRARTGIGCCPGIVRARVRIVKDPSRALRAGEILVAERTDPGWVVLFPAAAGILVERGSVLSHAAIVSREMGIPSVVGIAGLTEWLRDGDLVEFDGRSGFVRRLERAIP